MKPHPFQVPDGKRIRVILSTDAKNEADDQYAIAYALMSPKLEVVGILAAHFYMAHTMPASAHYAQGEGAGLDSVDKSYDEIVLLLKKMGLEGSVPVLRGARRGIEGERTPADSEAARFIVEEAHRPGAPLYVINIGAITDLASAYLMDPSIAGGIEAAVWVGAMMPSGGSEFNLLNDVAAGNVVMDSKLNTWLLPVNATAPMRVSFSELYVKVYPYGEVGHYLVEQMMEHNRQAKWPNGESWIIWDIAAVAVLIDPHEYQYKTMNAPRFDSESMAFVEPGRPHPIRVYERIEPRFALEDLFCKLALHFDKE
jgi:hypothetical protein